MSSTSKTQYFSLNQWVGSDIPKRIDFNSDNKVIDKALGEHINNEGLHVTQTEKDSWNQNAFFSGTYFGTNAVHRQIAVGFQPKVVFVAANAYPAVGFDTNGSKVTCYSGMALMGSGSLGLSVTTEGFAIDTTETMGNCVTNLNKSGVTYTYVAFR